MADTHRAQYAALRVRVAGVVRDAGADAGTRPVPATPSWTVHELLSHMVGVCDDVLNGRLEGVATDQWTAAQVDARAGRATAELLYEWDVQGPRFEDVLEAMPDAIAGQALFDAVTHEHDMRHALGAAGARDSEAVAMSWVWLVGARAAGEGDAVRVMTAEGDDAVLGPGAAVATVKAPRFEVLRACTGRRSAGEIAAYGWEPEPRPDLLLAAGIFTLRPEPLHE
jgi:hypothetical protein